FIASSALRVVLVAHRKVLALKGRFLLCSMPGPIADVFQVSGFRKFLEIEPDRATAVRRAMPEGYVPPEPGPAPGRGLGAAAVAAQARPGSILDARERTARRPGVFRRILRFLFG
ncbi:MAG: STAS domain-containing protein, partial [Acidobacteria bacterium]|nr:STAS domain-containing protein [Acidobacteriota bacterium]